MKNMENLSADWSVHLIYKNVLVINSPDGDFFPRGVKIRCNVGACEVI